MAISGSQKALMYAIGGIARGGATRGGYVSGQVFISLGGQQIAYHPLAGLTHRGVLIDSLTITDELDETANRCTFRIIGGTTSPPVTTGQEVILTLGSINNGERLFAGHVIDTQQSYWEKPVNIRWDVTALDYSWQFGFVKVTKQYTNQSATAIAKDLVATYAAVNGFTSKNVVAGLPVVPEITYTNEDLTDALTRLARRIGAYWYVDYVRDVHLFFSETGNGAPVDLTPTHKSLANLVTAADRSQVLTRVFVEGRGSRLLNEVAIGDTKIPLEAVDMFAVAPDIFAKVSFQGSDGGAQHLLFTGVIPGGAGTLVGPGIGPSAAPTATVATGTGLGTGLYAYAVTFTTASGESLPSPIASVTTGVVEPPTSAPTIGTPTVGPGPNVGVHQYAVTFTTAAGETTPSPLSSQVWTGSPSVPNPTAVPSGWTPADNYFAALAENGLYKIKYVYSTDTALPPVNVTLASPPSATIRANNTAGGANNAAITSSIPCSSDPAVKFVHMYRTTNGGSTFYRGSRFTNVPGTFIDYAGTPSDATIVSQGTEPVANTTPVMSTVPVSGIWGSYAGVTGRKLYRTAAGGAQLKLLATIPDNSTSTYTDTTPDAALGANVPTTNTASAAQVVLTNIPLGSTAVTGRKVYRTVVAGAQLKLQSTLANNTVTTLTDSTADGSLGANMPTGDTSALTQPDGQIVAGAPSIVVAGTAAFQATGGWAIIGNGAQVIRYTGFTGSALSGIPASGIGAITATITYNSTITAAPMLIGIPLSGNGAITRALTAGDEVYLVVYAENATAAATLAATMGGNGWREEWDQDRRLSIAEARARAAALLALRPLDQVRLTYTCRDGRTASGKTITVNLPAPINLTGTYKIQQVSIGNFRPHATQYPTYTVEASTSRYSFEDLLRSAKTKE